jgi:GNAT superfamily N-acetyltransferase
VSALASRPAAAIAPIPAAPAPQLSRVRVRDGRIALIRDARPEDRVMYVTAVDGLSEQSRYQRFLSPLPRLPKRALDRLMDLDPGHQVALHVTDETGTAIIAVARFVFTGPHEAELAITVGDCWQRQGLGRALLDALVAAAQARGVARLTGEALSENRAITSLLRSRGFARDGRVSVTTVWAREL